MDDRLSKYTQVLSLSLWINFNTKLHSICNFNGVNDSLIVSVKDKEEFLVQEKIENISKKSIERIDLELKPIINQLIHLKQTDEYHIEFGV